MRARHLVTLALVCLPSTALAQFAPGMGPMPGPGAGAPGQEEKQGPAEQAPKSTTAQAGAATPGWPAVASGGTKFLDLDGYFRLRTNYYHMLDLGLPEGIFNGGPTGFPSPLDCWKARAGCGNHDISTSDMRLRLQPGVHVTEDVVLKSEIDVLDNVVLGSTPSGFFVNGTARNGWTPINYYANGQVAPEAGQNALEGSIHAKRAWAEVHTALGELRFGRMPSMWGLGMLTNDGECLDCNFGDSADRVMFVTKLAGYTIGVGRDWVADGPTSSIIPQFQSIYVGGQGQPIELYNPSDVRQYFLEVGQIDRPSDFQARVDRGDFVVNWGLYTVYRWQYWDYYPDPNVFGQPSTPGVNPMNQFASPTIFQDNAWSLTPDAYLHVGVGKLDIQAEVAGVVGHIDSLAYLDPSMQKETLLQIGGVLRGNYHALGDDLLLGAEIGYASGDEAEERFGNPNVFTGTPIIEPPGDQIIANFRFNPDFQPDQILFRQVLGTVTNATYVKPYIAYSFVRPTVMSPTNAEINGRLDFETAFANQPVSTPGHDWLYGFEPDVSLNYFDHSSGFYTSLIWGILFPQGALDRPTEIFNPQLMPNGNQGNAHVAQTVRLLLGVRY